MPPNAKPKQNDIRGRLALPDVALTDLFQIAELPGSDARRLNVLRNLRGINRKSQVLSSFRHDFAAVRFSDMSTR
jgi:hypothetical protein